MAGCKDSYQEGQRLDVMDYVRVREHSGGKDTQIFCGKTCMKGVTMQSRNIPQEVAIYEAIATFQIPVKIILVMTITFVQEHLTEFCGSCSLKRELSCQY